MAGFTARLRQVIWFANICQVTLAGWIVLVIMILTSYGVFVRYVLGKPDLWSFPVSAYLLCFVVFLAAAPALQNGVHVRVDFLARWLPRPIGTGVRLFGELATVGFLLLFSWQAWVVFDRSLQRGYIDESTLGWPLAIVQWVIPFGGILMLITQVLLMLSRWSGEAEDS